MKKLLLILGLMFTLQAVSANEDEVDKSCNDTVYAILHQSCTLNLEQQKSLLDADFCSTIDDSYYFFYYSGVKLQYDVATCSFFEK